MSVLASRSLAVGGHVPNVPSTSTTKQAALRACLGNSLESGIPISWLCSNNRLISGFTALGPFFQRASGIKAIAFPEAGSDSLPSTLPSYHSIQTSQPSFLDRSAAASCFHDRSADSGVPLGHSGHLANSGVFVFRPRAAASEWIA
jgi:hypothetical protein